MASKEPAGEEVHSIPTPSLASVPTPEELGKDLQSRLLIGEEKTARTNASTTPKATTGTTKEGEESEAHKYTGLPKLPKTNYKVAILSDEEKEEQTNKNDSNSTSTTS